MTIEEQKPRLALVTGASRGIGAEIALRLADDGFTVAVHYGASVREALQLVDRINARGGDAFAVQADLSNERQIGGLFTAIAERCPRLDVVVHNAGIQLLGSHAEMDGEAADEVVAVNLKAAFHVLAHAARQIVDGGRIVALSSGTTFVLPPRYGIYAATKAGVETLVAVLAKEMRGRSITVNAVSPGPIATELYLKDKSQADLDVAASRSPLGRLGQPDDIAGVVAFLVGERGGWINGQTVVANGGFV